eukprot:8008500-Pyramimonas_sp.AAC.1
MAKRDATCQQQVNRSMDDPRHESRSTDFEPNKSMARCVSNVSYLRPTPHWQVCVAMQCNACSDSSSMQPNMVASARGAGMG